MEVDSQLPRGDGQCRQCLVVTCDPPMASFGGTPMRVGATVEALRKVFDVTVVVVGEPRTDDLRRTGEFCAERGVRLVVVPAQARRGGVLSIGGLMMRGGSTWTQRIMVKRAPSALRDLVDAADLVWVCRIFPFQYWSAPRRPYVLDIDDLDDRTTVSRRTVGMWLIRRALRNTRTRLMSGAAVSLTCSEVDRARLGGGERVAVLPNTYPGCGNGEVISLEERPPIVLLVGRMGYWPNREGAEWFARAVWPRVLDRVPSARLRIVGLQSERVSLGANSDGVEIVGEVDDMCEELDRAVVSVAPIFAGSGTRIKIIEAMSAGVPVVATTIAAEGIDVIAGDEIMIADDEVAFGAAVADLLESRARGAELANRARHLYRRTYSPTCFSEAVASATRTALT